MLYLETQCDYLYICYFCFTKAELHNPNGQNSRFRFFLSWRRNCTNEMAKRAELPPSQFMGKAAHVRCPKRHKCPQADLWTKLHMWSVQKGRNAPKPIVGTYNNFRPKLRAPCPLLPLQRKQEQREQQGTHKQRHCFAYHALFGWSRRTQGL